MTLLVRNLDTWLLLIESLKLQSHLIKGAHSSAG